MKQAACILAPVMAATLALAAAGAAQAQAVRSERNMSLELANQIAGATVAACLAGGYNVTAAVVDRSGHPGLGAVGQLRAARDHQRRR